MRQVWFYAAFCSFGIFLTMVNLYVYMSIRASAPAVPSLPDVVAVRLPQEAAAATAKPPVRVGDSRDGESDETPAPPRRHKGGSHHHGKGNHSSHHGKKGGKHGHGGKGHNKDAEAHGGDGEAPAGKRSSTPKPRKKQPGYVVKGRQAFHVDCSSYSNTSYAAAAAAYDESLAKDVGNVEQSSAHFTDYRERGHCGVVLPPEPIYDGGPDFSDAEENAKDACDPLDNEFTAELDHRCMRYLRNPANWHSVKVMSSILSTGRTIKFKVFYKHNNVSAVMKVSQKKFVLEPASEVMAWHADRLLGFQRVPPVAWVPFPLRYLQAAAGDMDAFYCHWFKLFTVDYAPAHAVHWRAANGVVLVNVSLQLWMFDVHDADETALNPPGNWRRYLEIRGSDGDADGAAMVRAAPAEVNTSIVELSDVAVFDYVIGNTDRWFGHNSFAFGGCEVAGKKVARCGRDTLSRHVKGPASYAYIDQGSSFYKRPAPEQNVYFGIAPKKKKDGDANEPTASPQTATLCRFHGRTARAVLDWAEKRPRETGQDLAAAIRERLPKGVFNLGNPYLVKAAKSRLDELARHIQQCLSRYGAEHVYVW